MHTVTKRVLLVNYSGQILTTNTFIPDNSLGTLAGVLRQSGINVEIIDLQNPFDFGSVMEYAEKDYSLDIISSLDNCAEPDLKAIAKYRHCKAQAEKKFIAKKLKYLIQKIKEENITLIGFKLWMGSAINHINKMVKEVKSTCPNVITVAGGPAVQYLGDYLKEYSHAFDHIIHGEAEQSILSILSSNINSLPLFLNSKRVFEDSLDSIPFPTYDKDIYPTIDTFYKIRIIDESRGCFNNCSFCSHSHFSGHGVRQRSLGPVVDEIQRLHEEDGIDYFRLSGSNPPWPFIVALGRELIHRNLKVYFSIFSSMNNVNAQDFPMLRQAGLCSIFYGIESGDMQFLKKVHKKNNISIPHIISTAQKAMENNIFITLSFIIPSPFETNDTKNKTYDLIKNIFSRSTHGSVMILPPFLSPWSQWWHNMEEYGFKFEKGIDRKKYLFNMIDKNLDFLLPKTSWDNLGYSLNGKSVPQLFAECAEFNKLVERLGIVTDFDDSSYMLSLMGNIKPKEFKKRIISQLLKGGAKAVASMVDNWEAT
ncbi:MAG: B12-binding domain-containing radical SAM protein [Bacteriovoracaceae bacterium]|nr:B12-binding domain-containing radical SAM protein [Bacteriovoracaceae bacterium]